MMMTVLRLLSRLLSLLGLEIPMASAFQPPPPEQGVFSGEGEGCRWIRGLRGQNPCAIGIQPVHTRVDSRGLPPRASRPGATSRQGILPTDSRTGSSGLASNGTARPRCRPVPACAAKTTVPELAGNACCTPAVKETPMSHRLTRKRQRDQAAFARWRTYPDSVFKRIGVSRERLEQAQYGFQGPVYFPGEPGYNS